jgi:hypothetical protein
MQHFTYKAQALFGQAIYGCRLMRPNRTLKAWLLTTRITVGLFVMVVMLYFIIMGADFFINFSSSITALGFIVNYRQCVKYIHQTLDKSANITMIYDGIQRVYSSIYTPRIRSIWSHQMNGQLDIDSLPFILPYENLVEFNFYHSLERIVVDVGLNCLLKFDLFWSYTCIIQIVLNIMIDSTLNTIEIKKHLKQIINMYRLFAQIKLPEITNPRLTRKCKHPASFINEIEQLQTTIRDHITFTQDYRSFYTLLLIMATSF